eukprot:1405566-Rhodomonas_salina.3
MAERKRAQAGRDSVQCTRPSFQTEIAEGECSIKPLMWVSYNLTRNAVSCTQIERLRTEERGSKSRVRGRQGSRVTV